MREFTCVVCGAKSIDKGSFQNKKYCSKECSNRYWNRKRYGEIREHPTCKYNQAVCCSSKDCENCGWHPDVIKKRKEAIV